MLETAKGNQNKESLQEPVSKGDFSENKINPIKK